MDEKDFGCYVPIERKKINVHRATWMDLKNRIISGESEKQNEIYKPEAFIKIKNTCTQNNKFDKSTKMPKDAHWHITLGGLVGEWEERLVIKDNR